MNLAGFCRNCLSNWYRDAAEARGLAMTKDESREAIYGMPYAEWQASPPDRGRRRQARRVREEPPEALAARPPTPALSRSARREVHAEQGQSSQADQPRAPGRRGAHGAFTWGVIDKLLEDGRLTFDAVSGTSAGALNAVVMIDGFERGGNDGARERLQEFWMRVSRGAGKVEPGNDVIDQMIGFGAPPCRPFSYFHALLRLPRPTGSIRSTSTRSATSSSRSSTSRRVQHCKAARLFISATNVRTGKIKVFTGKEVTADAVMASACLPNLFRAVEIGDEAYWDGGYMGNPALFPFFEDKGLGRHPARPDQSHPAGGLPRTGAGDHRAGQRDHLNASLLRELRAIDFVNRLLAESRLDPATTDRTGCTASRRRRRSPRTTRRPRWTPAGVSSRSCAMPSRAGGVRVLKDHYADVGVRGYLDLGRSSCEQSALDDGRPFSRWRYGPDGSAGTPPAGRTGSRTTTAR